MARASRTTSTQHLVSLSLLAPIVIGQRLSRMGTTSAATRRADHAEWQRMTSEKFSAGAEAWFGFGRAMLQAQHQWLTATMPRFGANASTADSVASPLHWWLRRAGEADAVLAATLAPAATRVRANAKRLTPGARQRR